MHVKSQQFRQVRVAHGRETAEDYVELIAELVTRQGEARLTEVAKRFGVSNVTAHKIIDRLQRERLVTSEPYRAIFLTPKGKRLALRSRQRHAVVFQLLRKLGVPADVAQVDAEGIEHHVSPTTLAVFKTIIKKGVVACLCLAVLCGSTVASARGSRERIAREDLALPVRASYDVGGAGAAPPMEGARAPVKEEPDYAFITGGPYTQVKRSIQSILANSWINTYDAGTIRRDWTSSLRTEWGCTDRLETDLIVPYRAARNTAAGATTTMHGFGDTVLGVRYRFLQEDHAPLTLTFGPQLILPSGDENKGFGTGRVGMAGDLTLAREWSPLFFSYASLNYSVTPGVSDPTAGSAARFTVHGITWGVAPTFRVLERDAASGNHHDIHLFLEGGGAMSQSVSAGGAVGSKATTTTALVAPGLRYGLMTPKKRLAEIGVSAPIGLNAATPDWGLILQLQVELSTASAHP